MLSSLQSTIRSNKLLFFLLLFLNFSKYFKLIGTLGKCEWKVKHTRNRRIKDGFTEYSKKRRPYQSMKRVSCVLAKSFYFIFYFLFYKLFIYLLIYFWLCWVFVSAHGLSLAASSGGYSSLRERLLIVMASLFAVRRLLIVMASLFAEHRL